jgi:LPS-assembly protein
MMRRALTALLGMRRASPGLAASKGHRFADIREVLLACILASVSVMFAPLHEAFGQAQTGLEQIIKMPKVGSSESMLLQADEMVYDNKNGTITAKGNVEIYYGDYTVLADRVIYDRNANTLTADGNVRMKDADGAVITSDHITLTDDFRDGFVQALKLVTKDDTRIVAQSASREAGNVTVFSKGWFTPCKPCRDNPSKPPTWRIRAKKITHKRDQAIITYNNAFFDFFGVPVLWLPYFQTADPTVKRKSGFLMPMYSHSNELGTTVLVPYYFALSNNFDFTFAPMWTENAGTLLQGNWRHRLATGGYNINLAGVWNKGNSFLSPNGTIESSSNGDFRGSIDTQGKFALDPFWAWGWDIHTQTDDTFRRFYNLTSRLQTDQISQVYLEGLHDRNYFSIRSYDTKSLLFANEPFSDATVYPIVDYDYIVGNPILGGELSFNSNAMVFQNQDGTNSDRMIVEANWRRQMIDNIGQIYTPFGRLRGDVYDVSGVDNTPTGSEDLVTGNHPSDGTYWQGDAVAGFEYRYPFIATTGPVTHVIEPIGQIIARPSSLGNQQLIPNEDALSLVFDDTLLFDIDKFSGYDRMETGTRANVGFRYTAQFRTGTYVRLVAGQSYQVAGQNQFDTAFYQTSGLATDNSDYVGGLYLQANTNLSFFAQSRFNHDTLEVERTDLGSSMGYGPLKASVNYANVPSGIPTVVPTVVPIGTVIGNAQSIPTAAVIGNAQSEILGSGSLALTTDWSLLGNLRYDLTNDQTITDGVGLQYQNDCLLLAVTYQRSFIHDQDIKPDERFLVTLNLKYLGGYSFSTSAAFAGLGSSTTP